MDERAQVGTLPTLAVEGPWNWERAATSPGKSALARAMAEAIVTRRWFGAKSRAIAALEIVDAIEVSPAVRLLLAEIRYGTGAPDVYQVPLGFVPEDAADELRAGAAAWIDVESAGQRIGLLYDALGAAQFRGLLLELFEKTRTLRGSGGELTVEPTPAFDRLRGDRTVALPGRVLQAEQSNTSLVYGDRLILKVFRRLERGLNPDFEISEFLMRQRFANTPELAGTLEYRPGGAEPWGLALLQHFVPSQGDAWQFTLDWLATALSEAGAAPPLPEQSMCRAAQAPIPPAAQQAFGKSLEVVALLGQRTAEMHLALAADASLPDFAPEPFSAADRRAYFQRCADEARTTFEMLAESASRLSGRTAERAERAAALASAAQERFARLSEREIEVAKIRCHGDYHLGQVLRTVDDFMIIDFEGEPVRSIAERRRKQLAMRDVAGMIRSLHYASCSAATADGETADDAARAVWTHAWYAWSSVAFLAAYSRAAGGAVFVPHAIDAFEGLLDGCLLEKALYELRYELNNRPDWVYLPLEALVELLGQDGRPG